MNQFRRARNGLRLQLAANTTTLRAVECGLGGCLHGERGRGCTCGRALGGASLCRPTRGASLVSNMIPRGTARRPTLARSASLLLLASLLLPGFVTVVAVCRGSNSRSSNTMPFTQGAGCQGG